VRTSDGLNSQTVGQLGSAEPGSNRIKRGRGSARGPCDGCESRARCARSALACAAFRDYALGVSTWRAEVRGLELRPLRGEPDDDEPPSRREGARRYHRPVCRDAQSQLAALAERAQGLPTRERARAAAELLIARPRAVRLREIRDVLHVSMTSICRAKRRLRDELTA
jgi:hypothetical protein